MKKNLLLTIALNLSFSFALFSQDVPDAAIVQKIRDEGLNHSKVMETAFYLTDVSGPRLSNSTNLKNAQNWAVSRLKSYGLTNVKLEPWGKFGKGWDVEKNYAAITVPYYHAIIAIPKAWTPGTNGPIKSEVVLIKADTSMNMDQYKGKLKGKIIIYEPTSMTLAAGATPDFLRYTDAQLDDMAKATAQPTGGNRRPANPQMAAMMRMRTFRTKLSAFLKDENVGLILSQARGTDGTVFTTNGASYADTAKAIAPELETSGEDYLRIVRLLKAGQKVEMEADIKTKFITNDLQGYNVVAEIPGTDKKLKDQVVMIGGHFDSWHGATGATDNAAGSAVMMEP